MKKKGTKQEPFTWTFALRESKEISYRESLEKISSKPKPQGDERDGGGLETQSTQAGIFKIVEERERGR